MRTIPARWAGIFSGQANIPVLRETKVVDYAK